MVNGHDNKGASSFAAALEEKVNTITIEIPANASSLTYSFSGEANTPLLDKSLMTNAWGKNTWIVLCPT